MFGNFFKPKDLWTAAKRGDTKAIEAFVAARQDINGKKETFRVEGDTPLHFAVRHGQRDAIKTLVKLGASINERNKSGQPPLMDAVTESRREDVVELLLDLGAKIDAQDKLGKTALDWAAFYGSVNLVQLLLRRGAKPNVGQGAKRTSSIAECAHHGNTEVLKLLLKAGVDVNAMRHGSHALGTASTFGHEGFVRLLLEAGADPNLAEEEGTTPLIAAVASKRISVVKTLVEAGAKLNVVRFGGRIETALDFAEWLDKKKTREIAEYLRSIGAKRASELPTSERTPPLQEQEGTFWQLRDKSDLQAVIKPWPPKVGPAKLNIEISPNGYDDSVAFQGTLEYRLGSSEECTGSWKPIKRGRKDEDNNVKFSENITLTSGAIFIQFKVQSDWDKEPTMLTDWKIDPP